MRNARKNVVFICTGDSDPATPWAELGYLQWHERAEEYNRRGIRQMYCTGCTKWRWPDEPCCDAVRWSSRKAYAQFRAAEHRIEKHRQEQDAAYVKAYRESL